MNPDGSRPLVVLADDRFGDGGALERPLLEAAGLEFALACPPPPPNARLRPPVKPPAPWYEAAREAEAVLLNAARADAQAIESLERCRVVARYGIGLDNVDLEAAAARGIVVRNVPGYCDDEVAEHAFAMILGLARGLAARDAGLRAGGWNLRVPARRLRGSVLGVLGFGGTGRALVRAALSAGFSRILVWSPSLDRERLEAGLGAGPVAAARSLGVLVEARPFDELLAAADFVSVHLPLKPETRGLVGARELGLMKPDAALVNVSRGAIVDEEALAAALRAGRLGGAGLDVFSAEPLPPLSPLRDAPNVVLSDHAAYFSRESVVELRRRTAANAVEELRKAGLLPG